MTSILKISEAASLAFHAMVYLASHNEKPSTTTEIAEMLNASEAHLSKVLQRLTKARYVRATRGPKGGFVLNMPSDKITLLDIFECIEGTADWMTCLFGRSNCLGAKCMFGNLIESINKQLYEYLQCTKLSEFTNFCKVGKHEHKAGNLIHKAS